MEIAIVIFLGLWLSVAALIAYLKIKKEFKSYQNNEVDNK